MRRRAPAEYVFMVCSCGPERNPSRHEHMRAKGQRHTNQCRNGGAAQHHSEAVSAVSAREAVVEAVEGLHLAWGSGSRSSNKPGSGSIPAPAHGEVIIVTQGARDCYQQTSVPGEC